MKSQEVQFGDWVRVFGQNGNPTEDPHWYNRKVTSDWIVNMEAHEAMLDNLRSYGVTIDGPQIGDTEAILLTEEILIANGFCREEKRPCKKYRLWLGDCYEDGYVLFVFHNFEDGPEISMHVECIPPHNSADIMVTVKHIHEVQHVLRICGLCKIANNFKV